jgi:integrase
MKLTAASLKAISRPEKLPKQREDLTVDGRRGLMVRVFPTGEVSFRFRYTYAGTRRVMVFGSFGEGALSLADAFEMHHAATKALALGTDPKEERDRLIAQREIERREREAGDTVESIINQFVHRVLRAEIWNAESGVWEEIKKKKKAEIQRRKRPEDAEALLRTNLIEAKLPDDGPRIGSIKVHELTKRQAVLALKTIVDRGAPVTANRVHALMVQLFDWAASEDYVPASIMAGTKRPGGTEIPRTRFLTDEEIRTVWTKLPTAKMEEPTRIALKLLLLTGQRRGELTLAQWQHFDLPLMRWTIPIELQKSAGRGEEPTLPHIVPLPPEAMELVTALHSLTGDGRWVLPSKHRTKKRGQPYSERALTRAVAKNQKHFGLPHWTPHDLRRSVISGMSKLGISRLHIKKVVGHAIQDTTEDYDQYDFLDEKKAALERWCAHVRAIVEKQEAPDMPNVS